MHHLRRLNSKLRGKEEDKVSVNEQVTKTFINVNLVHLSAEREEVLKKSRTVSVERSDFFQVRGDTTNTCTYSDM